MTLLKARFDGRVLIPVSPVDLPIGRELEIEVRTPSLPKPVDRATIAEVLQSMVPISREDAEAFEQAIETGKMPVRHEGPFD